MYGQGFAVTVSVEPGVEPISTADAKTHLRGSGSDEDAYIDTLVKAARRQTENHLRRSLITQTRVLRLDCFPTATIELPYAPVQSVTSLTYLDADGAQQTMSAGDYRVDIYSLPPRITLAYGAAWPSIYPVSHAVAVTYVCGYGAAGSSVPLDIIHAIKLQLTHLYENRGEADAGSSMVPAADALLSPYRIRSYA